MQECLHSSVTPEPQEEKKKEKKKKEPSPFGIAQAYCSGLAI